MSSWFEYVRSEANIADLPSRNEFGKLIELGSVLVPLRMPQVDDWFEPARACKGRGSRGLTSGADRRRAKGGARPQTGGAAEPGAASAREALPPLVPTRLCRLLEPRRGVR